MAIRNRKDKVKAEITKKEICMQWFTLVKLWLDLAALYQLRYLVKAPTFDSDQTGIIWMREIMDSQSDAECLDTFRMERHVLDNLCKDLVKYGLTASRNMSVLEKLGVFLYMIATGASNRVVAARFQRSGDTISRVVHQVLDALVGRSKGFNALVRKLVQPRDKHFSTIPSKIQSQERYQLFKDAIGCLGGTHIDACIPKDEQFLYLGQKNYCTYNVLGVCDFDMYFTYVMSGWEGSAPDVQVLDHALNTPKLNFPHPPPGRYYLLDNGYPDRKGFMVPYSEARYHRSQFQTEAPQNAEEGFNYIHSSLHMTIKRCFGILKRRFKVLLGMPKYSIETQNDIIVACFGLHNYILQHNHSDTFLEDEEVEEPSQIDREDKGIDELPAGTSELRAAIAGEIWANKSRYL